MEAEFRKNYEIFKDKIIEKIIDDIIKKENLNYEELETKEMFNKVEMLYLEEYNKEQEVKLKKCYKWQKQAIRDALSYKSNFLFREEKIKNSKKEKQVLELIEKLYKEPKNYKESIEKLNNFVINNFKSDSITSELLKKELYKLKEYLEKIENDEKIESLIKIINEQIKNSKTNIRKLEEKLKNRSRISDLIEKLNVFVSDKTKTLLEKIEKMNERINQIEKDSSIYKEDEYILKELNENLNKLILEQQQLGC